jgi:hypothetical protein
MSSGYSGPDSPPIPGPSAPAPAPAPAPWPAYAPVPMAYAPARPANWKRTSGVVKLVGQIVIGTGIVLVGCGFGYLSCSVSGSCTGTQPALDFYNLLEAGTIVAGCGVMVMGIALFLESLHRDRP